MSGGKELRVATYGVRSDTSGVPSRALGARSLVPQIKEGSLFDNGGGGSGGDEGGDGRGEGDGGEGGELHLVDWK
jgi:hypothetical protein